MVKKYIIMCGGKYNQWEKPRQLSIINRDEELVARTIRLLRENGITDISISSDNPAFKKFGVPILTHKNDYVVNSENRVIEGQWFDAFYPTEEPTCYIFGDVFFSPAAIKKIVETETEDIELFGSKKPFDKNYIKEHEEPFALKVENTKHLKEAIEESRKLDEEHKFWRKPIVWELFTVIKKAPLQTKRDHYTTDYVGINDYTCDIDRKEDIEKLQKIVGGYKMITVEVIEPFTLARFEEIRGTIKRKRDNVEGKLFPGDTFECSEELADYLTGNNAHKLAVVKVIEVKVVPEAIIEEMDKYAKETEAKAEFLEEAKPSLKVKKTTKKKKRS